MHDLDWILFGLYPYVVAAVCLIGSFIRFERAQYTWRSGSSQLLRRNLLVVGSNFFHVGILVILGGHVVGLLTPPAVYHELGLTTEAKQLLAMSVGGAAGLLCFVGMSMLIYRRLSEPRIRATSSVMDMTILLLLYAQLCLGLGSILVSAHHLDGAEMLKLAGWAQALVTFRLDAAMLIANVHPIFKLHIFLGLTIFLLFPFSRLVHIWSAPVSYVARPYQLVRRRGAGRAKTP